MGISELSEISEDLETVFNDIVDRKSFLLRSYQRKSGLHDKISFDNFLVDDYKLNNLYWEADQLAKKLIHIQV